MSTKLVFSTPEVSSDAVPAGHRKLLGTVDVSPFSQIRVVAGEGAGSPMMSTSY